jgi:hypothetical protein
MRIIDCSATMADALAGLTDDSLKRLLQQRVEELAEYGTDLRELACFAIIEPGDRLDDIEAAFNLPIATNLVDGCRFGEPDFEPSAEFIARHPGWFELVYILTDDGFGWSLWVPDADGIDPKLLSLARTFANAL